MTDAGAPEILFEIGFTCERAEALVRELSRLIAASNVHGKGAHGSKIPQTRALLATIAAQLARPESEAAAELGGTAGTAEEDLG